VAENVLWSVPKRLTAQDRVEFVAGMAELECTEVRGGGISLDVFSALIGEFNVRVSSGLWTEDRAASDRWLAPRLHFALRLTRAEASDRGVWQWLALQAPRYLKWRWSDGKGVVADNHWWGAINKQAFARLWWGAEIFRNGPDYSPAVQAFVFQDLPNSYLHRPLVRCRSLALALVNELAPADGKPRSSNEVNDLARVLNLATTGSPPEIETDYQADDSLAFATWAASLPSVPGSWHPLPIGPNAADTTDASRSGGRTIVRRGSGYAKLSER
jgi:hypothetical protein